MGGALGTGYGLSFAMVVPLINVPSVVAACDGRSSYLILRILSTERPSNPMQFRLVQVVVLL